MRFFISALLFQFSVAAHASAAPPDNAKKIRLREVITELPDTAWDTLKFAASRDALPGWATILGTTAVLYHYDPDLYNGARNDGQRWGIGSGDEETPVISAFGLDILKLPSSTGSALYFLGDGWVHLSLAAGLFVDGLITDDTRPYNTGLEIAHGLVVASVFEQVIKRSVGRESPNRASESRGRFRPFPSLAGYQHNTSLYDAFPSGHIMTASLAFTVINTNYPEYFYILAPFETLWLAGLGFEMVNNGVHWASDYPLGLAIGYVVGKMSTRLGQSEKKLDGRGHVASSWTFFPSVGLAGPEMNALYSF